MGPCDALAHKKGRQNPTKGGDQPSALEALPLALTRARGRARSPAAGLRENTGRAFLDKVWPQNKKKNKTRKTRKTLAASRPKKGASEGASELKPHKFQENQKRAGPRMAPREKRREAGRTAKTGETEKSGGTQKEKEATQVRVRGVSCYYLNFVSQKKKKKKPKQKRRRRET